MTQAINHSTKTWIEELVSLIQWEDCLVLTEIWETVLMFPCKFLFCRVNEWWQSLFQHTCCFPCTTGGTVISLAVSKADITELGRELTESEGTLLSELTYTHGVTMHHHRFNVACCCWMALFGLIVANGALIWQLKIKRRLMKYLVLAHRSALPLWVVSLGLWLCCCTEVFINQISTE